ncbi:MAG: lysine 2,3-aminomutase [Spirochaetales bacterium]
MIQTSFPLEEDPPSLSEDPPDTIAASKEGLPTYHLPSTDLPDPTDPSPTPLEGLRILYPQRERKGSSREFRHKFYPHVTRAEWNDWRWQLAHRITSYQELERILYLSEHERQIFLENNDGLPLSITPYYASLLDAKDPLQSLRRSVVPVLYEKVLSPSENIDPLGEDHDSPVPGLVHRYPDRVLFLATYACSTYCRYCTRSRAVGHQEEGNVHGRWEKAFQYIEEHPEVRDVLISGGDPLTLPDESIDYLLSRVSSIPHVEFIRIGTKVPAVLPQRITPSLLRVLKKYRPLWISIHATHPDELTPEMRAACNRLADAGIPLGSQTVLLAGINDSVETLRKLFHGLLTVRVRPYYLYQCDPIPGSAHFRTSVKKALEIMRGLRGFTTGYAVPTYVIDAPGGGGKIPLLPEYVVGYENGDLLLRNFEGNTYRYPDPGASEGNYIR